MPTARIDKYGPVFVPPATGAAGATLQTTCDPALSGLLSDFATILNTKLAAAWKAAAGTAMPTSNLVDFSILHEPDALIARRTWSGGALFMWRASERYFRRTNRFRDIETTVKLNFLLPPLPEELAVKLEPIRTAVRTVLMGFVEYKGDPTLKSGTLLSSYNLESFAWTESRYGLFQNEANLAQPFPSLDMTALMRERETHVLTQYAELTRLDTTITSKDDSGETTVAQQQLDPP